MNFLVGLFGFLRRRIANDSSSTPDNSTESESVPLENLFRVHSWDSNEEYPGKGQPLVETIGPIDAPHGRFAPLGAVTHEVHDAEVACPDRFYILYAPRTAQGPALAPKRETNCYACGSELDPKQTKQLTGVQDHIHYYTFVGLKWREELLKRNGAPEIRDGEIVKVVLGPNGERKRRNSLPDGWITVRDFHGRLHDMPEKGLEQIPVRYKATAVELPKVRAGDMVWIRGPRGCGAIDWLDSAELFPDEVPPWDKDWY